MNIFFLFLGRPVVVGMSINIASIDSISEVNMVSSHFLSLMFALTFSSTFLMSWEEQPVRRLAAFLLSVSVRPNSQEVHVHPHSALSC